jgi:hypothetical protein
MTSKDEEDGTNAFGLNGRIRGTPPPKKIGLELEVVRIVSTEIRLYVLLSTAPWGSFFHWAGGSIPCTGDPEECERCKKLVPRKWRGYIHALEQHGTSTREVILELTHSALATLDLSLAMREYRGSMVQLRKTKGGAKGRFLIDVLDRRVTDQTLPADRDPAPVLKKLWELNERRYSNGK